MSRDRSTACVGATRANATGVALSIVIPFFNESVNVHGMFARLIPVLNRLQMAWEVVCVNDGSTDDTRERLIEANRSEPRIKIVDLSRNFGKDAALSAGLAAASGDAVVPMDGDLQHPPEVIPELVAKWREGFEVVYAVRRTRDDQTRRARIAARLFYWVFARTANIALPPGAGDFRLLDRRVVNVLNAMPERDRFMKGLFAWVGFRQTGVPYDVADRAQGRSKWRFRRLLRFGIAGITGFSNVPLRVWGVIGAGISLLAFFYIVVRLLRTALYGIDVPGYESIIVTILFLGGIQLVSLGVIGEYLGRVFDEVKGRPLYVLREKIGFSDVADGRPPENRATTAPGPHDLKSASGA